MTSVTSAALVDLDVSSPRLVNASLVAEHFGSELALQRHILGGSPEDVFTRLAATFHLGGLSPAEHHELGRAIAQAITDDRVYDSEAAMATRAVLVVLRERTGKQVEISGAWLTGEQVLDASGRSFELTGGTCPACDGPAAHGRGGGLVCVDMQNCCWFHCF